MYFSVHKTYADDWQDLTSFIENGKVPITQVTEKVFSVNGKDSIAVTIDTLRMKSAIQEIREHIKITDTELAQLSIVPQSGKTFELYANEFEGRHVVEVKDPAPINPRRQEDGDLKPLRFGSKAAASLKGNWE